MLILTSPLQVIALNELARHEVGGFLWGQQSIGDILRYFLNEGRIFVTTAGRVVTEKMLVSMETGIFHLDNQGVMCCFEHRATTFLSLLVGSSMLQ